DIIWIAVSGGVIGGIGGYFVGRLHQLVQSERTIRRLQARIKALTPKKKRIIRQRKPYDCTHDETMKFPCVEDKT
ncbi:MAG: hypothetical protein Q4D42_13540, partial [Eubacteriales bacterium]|nr:hypothetical protein [Eubacteriales bacterium]